MAHTTAWKKFHKSSMLGNGSSDYLSVPISDDWRLLTVTDFTIHSWWNTPASLVAGAEQLFGVTYDAYHNWSLIKNATTNKLNFIVNGVDHIAASAVDPSTVYHIAVCKVGNDLGVYLDGVQIIHADLSGIPLEYYGDVLAIAGRSSQGVLTMACNWHFDEPTIIHDNLFTAAPNVGLTDTITVPTAALTWEG
jgi:hypothetical protein